jgi:hypothetical protein
MCELGHHIFGAESGLPCLGVGPNHARQYAASDACDGHDASESLAEQERA